VKAVIADSTKPVAGVGRICRWALGHALRRKSGLAAVAAVMLAKILLDVLKPWPLKILVDYVLQGQPMPPPLADAVGLLPGGSAPADLLTWCVAGTVVLFLGAWALGVAASLANVRFATRMVYDLAGSLFAHLLRLPLGFHVRKPIGDSVRRVTSDSGCVATIVKDALLPLGTALVSLAAMFTIMCWLDPILTLLSLAVVPGLVLILRRYAGPMIEHSYRQQEAEGHLYDVVEHTLSAVPVVQAFGQEERADRHFADGTEATLRATLSTTSVQLRFKVLTGLMMALGTAGVLWVGGLHVLDGRLGVGSILIFLSYLASLYGPLETLMYMSSTIQGAAGSARRVLELLETEPELRDRPGAKPLPVVSGRVRLDYVTFGYQPGRPVLRGVSLEVLPGQTVGIVGYTGAGKTTLVSLVARFFDPWQGRVTVDGHDVRDVALRSLRRQVAVVLQEPVLFPLTVAENIAYGRPGASRAEIEAAARAANAHTFVERLPQGYDTRVGERGATLSGGERQRISIARALLKNAPILILDEPTSALEADTEGLLLGALEQLMAGRTTLLIAHRLSTLRHASWILVLDEGRVAERGTEQELLAHKGLYSHLHGIQFGLPAAIPHQARP
jgi:ATP-binding cassette subfamily B protein/subfamily B ATP-binding cassette protein MsbA